MGRWKGLPPAGVPWVAHCECAEPHAEHPRGVICSFAQEADMEEVSTAFVGLDVHSQSTAIAVAHAGREAPRFVGTVGARLSELIKALDKLGKPSTLLVVYEAGPCGYTLVRELRAKGYRCEVVAPSLIARKPAERVKTDRRDALKLAALARSGDLTTVNVPDEQDEAIRDLCRARVDAVKARLKARQQLKAMLLRHGRRYTGKSSWTAAHERYLAAIGFEHPAQDIAFTEYRQAVSEADARVQRLTQALAQQIESWRMLAVVHALMTLRGLDLVAATTVVAELGDMRRFAHPRDLMGYLGWCPASTPAGRHGDRGKLPRPATGMHPVCSWRLPGTIGSLPASAASCRCARKINPQLCARLPGVRNCACVSAIGA